MEKTNVSRVLDLMNIEYQMHEYDSEVTDGKMVSKLVGKGEDEVFKTLYEKMFTYAFTVFPNHEIGEWEQIRKEDGTAEDKVVALPVKDPFHTLRCFIKIVETCL